MNAMIISALAAFGIAGFFSAVPSDPQDAKDGCCSKPAGDHCGKKPDNCCETKTASCCEKKDECCSRNTQDGKQGQPASHCIKDQKSKAPGRDVEGPKAEGKHEHKHQQRMCDHTAGDHAGCMK